ncbi:hypothetical protein NXH67_14330 [Butyrivibrio sp. DSM 10294]|uniref:hypothetical protein n=1 Tax=Butyrivibrio sp. DSM 10294 TaxID=2972457 RepID=UPI00234EBCB2|nr:hypothetical protein [Butyrivibrio sp. DSM 10294]MDC7294691.1 hypothetical protein [Butyrivibrio sp. DSM 10294]
MAFRISELTSAVNSYLNSISSVNSRGSSIGEDLKGIFQKYFSKAVNDTKVEAPNIRDEIKNNIDSHNFATKTTAEATKETAKTAGSGAGEVSGSASNAAASNTTASNTTANNATNLASLITASRLGGNLGIADALETIMKANSQNAENADVYKGILSDKALRDLSDSSYFYTNMVQSSLFKTSDEDEDVTGSTTTNSIEGQTLEKLNENSLLNATLGTSDYSYYQSLLQAYKSTPTESVFGDYLL